MVVSNGFAWHGMFYTGGYLI